MFGNSLLFLLLYNFKLKNVKAYMIIKYSKFLSFIYFLKIFLMHFASCDKIMFLFIFLKNENGYEILDFVDLILERNGNN